MQEDIRQQMQWEFTYKLYYYSRDSSFVYDKQFGVWHAFFACISTLSTLPPPSLSTQPGAIPPLGFHDAIMRLLNNLIFSNMLVYLDVVLLWYVGVLLCGQSAHLQGDSYGRICPLAS